MKTMFETSKALILYIVATFSFVPILQAQQIRCALVYDPLIGNIELERSQDSDAATLLRASLPHDYYGRDKNTNFMIDAEKTSQLITSLSNGNGRTFARLLKIALTDEHYDYHHRIDYAQQLLIKAQLQAQNVMMTDADKANIDQTIDGFIKQDKQIRKTYLKKYLGLEWGSI